MRIITFSGVDGSGKSTQRAMLQTWLENQDKRVEYFHAVSFSLLETLRGHWLGSRAEGSAQANMRKNFLTLFLRQGMFLIDLMRFRLYCKKLMARGIEYLISDRYFYDSLINIAYLGEKSLTSGYFRLAQKYLIEPDTAFYLKIAPEYILERERVPEQGLEYLKQKTALLNMQIQPWSFIVIDANQPKESVTQAIQEHLLAQNPSLSSR